MALFKKTVLTLITSLLLGSISLGVSADPLSNYSATYSAEFNGMEIEATHRLEQLESGQYRETLKARNILGKIDEQALFKLSDQQQIIPQEYGYKRSLIGIKRTESQIFDWPNNRVQYSKGDKKKSVAVTPGLFDIITHKLQLRRDLQSGKEILAYPVISRGKLKQYVYEVVANEVLETAIGPLNTVKLQRIREDEKRQTVMWLATDWDYLAVKLEQIENGDSHQMNILNGQINNKPILPLATVTEKNL
ncbi:DUF3108 domain-containing protein [Porticoccaceae bacterium]|nr:DUF3108 domain-containing protein [Porticoccaceae bacterium]